MSEPFRIILEPRQRLASASIVTLIVLLALCIAGPLRAQTMHVSIGGDDPTSGIFDPSVEYAPASGEGWLAYSAVFGALIPWGPHVETRIASSGDGGASWVFETVAVPSTIDQLV